MISWTLCGAISAVLCVLMAKCVYLYVLKKKCAKMLYIFGKSHKTNYLYTRYITGLHLKDAKRKVKALLNIIFCFLIFNNFYFNFILAILSCFFMDVGCYTVKLQICCFNSCLLYMYIYIFFSTRSPNILHLHVLDRIKLTKYIDEFKKRWCLVKYTKPQFALFCLAWSFWKS